MHNQFNYKMHTFPYVIDKKELSLHPVITGETICSCRHPAFFQAHALCEIGIIRHNDQSHVLLRAIMKIPMCFFLSMKECIKCIIAIINKSELLWVNSTGHANFYIIGLVDADPVTFHISQCDSRHRYRIGSVSQCRHNKTGFTFFDEYR